MKMTIGEKIQYTVQRIDKAPKVKPLPSPPTPKTSTRFQIQENFANANSSMRIIGLKEDVEKAEKAIKEKLATLKGKRVINIRKVLAPEYQKLHNILILVNWKKSKLFFLEMKSQ